MLSPYSHVPQEWRRAFLTAGTWAGMTPTDKELQYALDTWTSTTTVEAALDVMRHRRVLDARGLLQREARLRSTADD